MANNSLTFIDQSISDVQELTCRYDGVIDIFIAHEDDNIFTKMRPCGFHAVSQFHY